MDTINGYKETKVSGSGDTTRDPDTPGAGNGVAPFSAVITDTIKPEAEIGGVDNKAYE